MSSPVSQWSDTMQILQSPVWAAANDCAPSTGISSSFAYAQQQQSQQQASQHKQMNKGFKSFPVKHERRPSYLHQYWLLFILENAAQGQTVIKYVYFFHNCVLAISCLSHKIGNWGGLEERYKSSWILFTVLSNMANMFVCTWDSPKLWCRNAFKNIYIAFSFKSFFLRKKNNCWRITIQKTLYFVAIFHIDL